VSGARKRALLLRCYPPAWRARYGEELEDLIVEAGRGRGMSWRVLLDIAGAGGRERLRAAGLTGDAVPPGERSRAGSLLVLCAWVLFVVAGLGVQKSSEHWQSVTPASSQGLPALAFGALVVAAALGSALVLAGIGCAAPSLIAFARRGGWREIRGAVVRAALITVFGVASTLALVIVAHRMSNAQREGHDLAYALGFGAWAVVILACLITWTVAGVDTARRLVLSARLLRLEAWLAAAVSTSMAAMTIATAVWWAALADAAPWFFSGRPAGTSGSAIMPQLVVAMLLMLVATPLSAAGAFRALGSLRTAS
jgi:hypothetical protein